MFSLPFLLSILLAAALHAVPSLGSAGVPANITLTRDSPLLNFSPDWKATNEYGTEIFLADDVGSELQVDQLVNATAVYFVGFKSTVGSTFAACVDCQPVRSPARNFQVVDAFDPSSPYASHLGPVVLFSMTGLDPTVPHSLRVVNLWDPKFGDYSRVTFDSLIVTVIQASNDGAANSSAPPGSSPSPQLSSATATTTPNGSVVPASLVATGGSVYPNTSILPMPTVTSTSTPASSTSTTSPGGNGGSMATSTNSALSNASGQPEVTTTTTAAGATETLTVPSLVGNSGSASMTPSESLQKALLIMMILLLIVFLACITFGIVALFLHVRARNKRLRMEADIFDDSHHGAGRITPFVMGTPSPNHDTNYRNSYTAKYHPSAPTKPLKITIPRTSYEAPISPESRREMAEVYRGAAKSTERFSSQAHLNPFTESVAEITTPAWISRSPRFKSPV
ncbi:hypothetical protein EIP91_000628 [Steccherinum ochraceum]|uniref:Mid2 domain-containing protein n=1 Tax=Steccherinum ochraceum TaxID=92696 RepID=A0A4R0RT55_9APHY|nr:hypothetical protein EIP91_000628 [Steccherinum ochraceum]